MNETVNQENLFQDQESVDDSQDIDSQVTWFAQPISVHKGKLDQLRSHLPIFDRKDFGSNEFLDVIVREPINGEPSIPVATVSKGYALIQHEEVFDAMMEGIKAVDFDTAGLEGTLTLSKYGERMSLNLQIPGFDFDPGDGHPIILMANCLNSVDKSTALVFRLSWKRLVCSNGMMFGIKNSRIRQIHSLQCTNPENIKKFLKDNFKRVPKEHSLYKKWAEIPIKLDSFIKWADEPLTKTWGSHAAARAYHIANTGWDGKIKDPFQKALPHEREISYAVKVPGSCAPVKNAFHVSQILSWLAREQKTVQGQFEKMIEIGDLMRKLLNIEKSGLVSRN